MRRSGFWKSMFFRWIIPLILAVVLVSGLTGCTLHMAPTDDPHIKALQNEIRGIVINLLEELMALEKFWATVEVNTVVTRNMKSEYAADSIANAIKKIAINQKKIEALTATWEQRQHLEEEKKGAIATLRTNLREAHENHRKALKQYSDWQDKYDQTIETYLPGITKVTAKEKEIFEDGFGHYRQEIDRTWKVVTEINKKIEKVTEYYEDKERKIIKSCFAGETRVLLPGGELREIRRLKAGDRILALDRRTKQLVPKRISKYERANSDHYYLVNEVLRMTAAHPVLTGDGDWVEVANLKVGMSIQGKEGIIPVRSISRVDVEGLEVFNFDVADGDNYLVAGGERFYVVHNGK